MQQVFARFVRDATSDVEGSRLGLPIVKSIAARYGARVALSHREDRMKGLVARVFSVPAS